MRKVIFELVKNATGMVLYPDDIKYFSNTKMLLEKGKIVADYSGDIELAGYVDTPDYGRIIATNKYLNRFNIQEKAMIEFLSIDDPAATVEKRLEQATIRQVLKMLDREAEIQLDNEEFKEATLKTCQLLFAAGLISSVQTKFEYLINTPLVFADLPERLKAVF